MYNIGFRIEPKGRTGFAHLFEHMMFQGSAQLKKMEHVQLCPQRRRRAQRLDALRLHQLLRGAAVQRARARAVARGRPHAVARRQRREPEEPAERRQRGGARQRPQPAARRRSSGSTSGRSANTNWHNAHNFYGDLAELDAATLDDVRAFFKTYYAPNNAVLVVVGDTTAAEVRDAGREALRRHSAAARCRRRPTSASRRRRQRSASPGRTSWRARRRWPSAWHLPPRMTKDFFALSVLDPLMVGDQSARLHQKLVREDSAGHARWPARSTSSAPTGT